MAYPFSTHWVNCDVGLSHHCLFLQALLFRIPLISVHIGTCCQFQQLPFSNETLVTVSGWEVYFLRNSLPIQSCISFASATFSVKQTLRAAPAGWKCPPLTCTALAECSGQVWNYALANKWYPTHSPLVIHFHLMFKWSFTQWSTIVTAYAMFSIGMSKGVDPGVLICLEVIWAGVIL